MPLTESGTETAIRGCVDVEAAVTLPVRVSLACSAPAAVSVGVLQLPVIPPGSPVTVKIALEALEAKETPPTGVTVAVTVALDIDCMLIDAGERARVTAGAAVTWSDSGACAVRPSPVATISSRDALTAAVVEERSVSVEATLPSPEGEKEPLVQLAVTPVGNPDRERLTAPDHVPPMVVVTCTAPDAPCVTCTVLAPSAMAKVGFAATVMETVAVAVIVTLVPVMTMLPTDAVAVLLTVMVAVVLASALTFAGLNATVTPLGAMALKLMVPVNPLVALVATVSEAALPGSSDSLDADAFRVNPFAVFVPPEGQSPASEFALTEPRPVTRL